MSASIHNPRTLEETVDTNWRSLYKLGATTALIIVGLMLLDITVSIFVPGGDDGPGTLSATEWFNLFQSNWFLGFRDLGFLNILILVLGAPLFLALYAVHRRVNGAYAALATVLFLVGGTLYISNNTANKRGHSHR